MVIEKISGSVKCDMASCKSKAVYSVDSKVSLSQNLNLCESCARSLYEALGKLFVPKSPKNMMLSEKDEKKRGKDGI
ncbi:MAG: hypothetical protein MRZ86_04525 [Acidaminococcus sp.]|nr:hypothetical protein [Acidaminococcus sp.]MDD7398418.1 hypothetical protein [Bacillota bacterium]MDY4559834.1 hypothetical protein [Eubacteriales bacterium]MDY5345633.1 hypothetical protein [Eubacteriales bacterium]